MLRKVRVALGSLSLTLMLLLFCDFTGVVHKWLGWLADVQLVPAVLATNVAIVVGIVVLTLILGRAYCSIICPLGITQDLIARLSAKRKKYRYGYSKPKTVLRLVVLGVFVVALLVGFAPIYTVLEPYSAFGRIAEGIVSPLYRLANNGLAAIAEHFDSYLFYSTEVWVKAGAALVMAVVTLIVVGILAWRGGRTYCNAVCPVGTLLGLIGRYSLVRVQIDEEKCNGCTLCQRSCKGSCIDAKNHQIDHSRCVVCLDCTTVCKRNAIRYTFAWKKKPVTAEPADSGRRTFLTATAALAASQALKAQDKLVDGGLATIEDKQAPERKTRLVPPGALGLRHFSQHCTACQLCVSKCPNGVLRPSSELDSFMQPEMSYERGYCRPECTRCSEVCPNDAIRPITRAEKSSTQIGHAVWIRQNCLVVSEDETCGLCARRCPSGAIMMIPLDGDETKMVPSVDVERCIGCGACENLCPARPFSAIYVEGHEQHHYI